jgi:predicted amidohydrolase
MLLKTRLKFNLLYFYLICFNERSGHSAIIDPLGVTLFEKAHQSVVHTQTISKVYLNKIRESLPFLKDRD